MSSVEQERRWYRQFWPWFIAIPPAAAVIGGFVTAWLAGAGPALVVDDYGQIGKVTTQRAVRDERARELGLSALIKLELAATDGGGVVSVDLASTDPRTDFPDTVVLQIVHPTLADYDAEAVLAGSRGHYAGRVARPVGRLYIHLTDNSRTWRLVGELGPRAAELAIVTKNNDRRVR